MFQTKVVEKIKTHFLISNFFFDNRAVYETMWKKYFSPRQVTDDNMALFHYMLAKVRNTQSEYVILIVFLLQQWLHERA
jgi:hypothetical protein